MRALAALALLLASAACRPATCAQAACPIGELCAISNGGAECFNPCDLDAGTCSDGTACRCAASCPDCKDCVRVCPTRAPL
jgi:hypothetical protein